MNSTFWASTKPHLAAFFTSKRYEVLIASVIAFNAVVMALETVPSINARFGGTINFFNALVLAIFVVEIVLRIATFQRRFVEDGWSWFDLVIVLVALLPASEAFGALRALRAVRLLRLITALPSLRRVVEGLIKAIPSLGSIVILMALLLFVFSLIGTRIFGPAHPELFGSLGASAFTLFTVMTLEGWPDLARAVMSTHPYAWTFFIVFIMLSSWAVLNLVIGVIVDSMQAHTRKHEEQLEIIAIRNQERMMAELAKLNSQMAQVCERLGVEASKPGSR